MPLYANGQKWAIATGKPIEKSQSKFEPVGDGKTRIHIEIDCGRTSVPFSLYFKQSVSRGVTIDWGDGSATTNDTSTSFALREHTYTVERNPYETKKITITLTVTSGTLTFGTGSTSYCICGSTSTSYDYVSRANGMIKQIELGNNVVISGYAFYICYSLQSVIIPNGVTSIGNYAFYRCYSLQSIVIPNSVTSIGTYAFYQCYSLQSIVIPNGVTSIGTYAFQDCYSLRILDFSNFTSIPSIGTTAITISINTYPVRIIVPDDLYDEWITTSNWPSYASRIIKVSQA